MENITEKAYMDLANESKEKFDEMNMEKIKLQEEVNQLKKELITTYGMVRIIDNLYCEQDEREPTIETLIDCLRSYLSEFFDNSII
jgi:hypothetical protein|tara:strand:- start:1195 stop:1452 length:258 start_codon:yes stop_codon:yes gene_type:complete